MFTIFAPPTPRRSRRRDARHFPANSQAGTPSGDQRCRLWARAPYHGAPASSLARTVGLRARLQPQDGPMSPDAHQSEARVGTVTSVRTHTTRVVAALLLFVGPGLGPVHSNCLRSELYPTCRGLRARRRNGPAPRMLTLTAHPPSGVDSREGRVSSPPPHGGIVAGFSPSPNARPDLKVTKTATALPVPRTPRSGRPHRRSNRCPRPVTHFAVPPRFHWCATAPPLRRAQPRTCLPLPAPVATPGVPSPARASARTSRGKQLPAATTSRCGRFTPLGPRRRALLPTFPFEGPALY